jgi:hypothetical protein
MTHDELLARIELWKKNVCLIPLKPKWLTGDCKCMTCVSLSALRAVVELHTTFTPAFGGGIDYCWADDRPYPCPTIQAIEKELK